MQLVLRSNTNTATMLYIYITKKGVYIFENYQLPNQPMLDTKTVIQSGKNIYPSTRNSKLHQAGKKRT